MPKFRTGTDDFKELIDDGGYYVDKSLLIHDVIEGNKVTLLPRPRRFGKTLNMTMLRYFFERSAEDRAPLFNGLAITKHAEPMSHQGQHPVIYLSLKDVKGATWADAYAVLKEKVSFLFDQHQDICSALEEVHQKEFFAVRNKTADQATFALSLNKLITHLHRHHGTSVVVLIDEYDSPVIEAWNKGYYEEMIDFMRSWLGGGLKHDNAQALYRAVVTGILRIAKESLFSGLNNLDVASMLEPGTYADKFGFTQPELDQILKDFDLPHLAEPMQEWYNGYDFGGRTIYNPWSVICCVQKYPAPVGPQWLNTASNSLVYAELERGGLPLKRDLEKLLRGEELRYPINENTVFDDIGRDPQNIWSFLFFSGYLKAADPQPHPRKRTQTLYSLSIPNLEISVAYEQFVSRWHQSLTTQGTEDFLDALLDEEFAHLEMLLQEMVVNLVSYHDVARYPEAVYHAFVLGLLANLRSIYDIRSNPEAGYGRADILMIPTHPDYPLGFVIEFKASAADTDLKAAAQSALQQIEDQAYDAPLLAAGTQPQNIRKLAIIVSGKRVKVAIQP